LNKASKAAGTEQPLQRDIMKKSYTLAGLAAAGLLFAAPAMAQDVKLGFLADVTGPIAGFAPTMVTAGNTAIQNVNDQGGILNGGKLSSVVADTACSADQGGPAADRLVNTEKVTAIFGAFCSGPTIAAANGAAIPGNVVMVSPSATAPAVSELKDNDLVFRDVVPDSEQGTQGAKLLLSKGIKSVALTYVNGDYGKGLADAFTAAYTAAGGKVVASVPHEDGKSDYRPEIGQLESSGADTLVIYGYENAGGGTILDQAVESGTFKQYVGGDGMAGDALVKDHKNIDGMILTKAAPAAGPAYDAYVALAKAANFDPTSTYAAQSYDAVFLLALAVEKNGSADRAGLSKAIRAITTGKGDIIMPGEWKKAVADIKAGKEISYKGASTDMLFDKNGDVPGAIEWFTIEKGAVKDQGLIK
jgi:branched-chain amino acid transport system substrate-binding protein